MSVDEWIKVPDNPRQRDTKKHAVHASKRNLKTYRDSHGFVFAAYCNGDVLCKLDGHTRSFLWANEENYDRPPNNTLIVCGIAVKDLNEATKLYTHFDNDWACESSSDKVFGACRQLGMRLNSPLLSKGEFVQGLKFATVLTSSGRVYPELIYSLVNEWKDELSIIDEWNMGTCSGIGSPLKGLMVMIVRSRKWDIDELEVVRKFFNGIIEDEGKKNGKKRDGIQIIKDVLRDRNIEQRMTGRDNLLEIMSECLMCFYWYENGELRERAPSKDTAMRKLREFYSELETDSIIDLCDKFRGSK
jgi:hypothetical protein